MSCAKCGAVAIPDRNLCPECFLFKTSAEGIDIDPFQELTVEDEDILNCVELEVETKDIDMAEVLADAKHCKQSLIQQIMRFFS